MQSSPVCPGPRLSPLTRSTILATVFGTKIPQEPFTGFFVGVSVPTIISDMPHPASRRPLHEPLNAILTRHIGPVITAPHCPIYSVKDSRKTLLCSIPLHFPTEKHFLDLGIEPKAFPMTTAHEAVALDHLGILLCKSFKNS